ncbi:hypothetical protein BLS_009645 [Venturia inaequalis]|uniref:Uncharacterized protein n=1 Tax=Venturia inaequalis TaxID=5025 RepID=A0A8H3Z9B9_VENIN|nr:hypothetical protein EG328_009609 [Venturia inaequalis]KAE9985167.1 hypothetical protein BLS_009645 [Venturia inaequalis]KAE9993191.1 hypothetical protein EG327_005992 [Venturia inaequalis]RDI86491.1 hypothetical protein Vi05172_g3537 [Venturia inaequalis]
MQLSSVVALLFSLYAFKNAANAYSCAPWVLPVDCLNEAAAFPERMKTATFPTPKPEGIDIPDAPTAGLTPDPPALRPKHRNCGTLGIMDANDAPCDKMYRPDVQPSPVPPPMPQVESEKKETDGKIFAAGHEGTNSGDVSLEKPWHRAR